MDITAPKPSADPLIEALDSLPLANLPEEGDAPSERLKTTESLRQAFTQMREDDRINAHNRAMQQGLLDGEPPYEDCELEDRPDTTNLNFQGAEERLERAMTPYYRLIHGNDTLLTVKTLFGPEDARADWEAVMAEEISKMIRRWAQFPYQIERLIKKHVWEGVGLLYWPTDIDWRPETGGLGQFYFPRQAAATETDQEIICSYEEYTITRLYRLIQSKSAESNGWNVTAAKEAIRKATSKEPAWQDWEKVMEEIKNNDLSTGSKLPKIRVIHGFVEEFNGKVSHYMTTEEACGTSEFLYKNTSEFDSMTEALVLFPYTTGTNNKIHGVRGLGYKIFPFEQQRNRSIGRLIDKGMIASSTMVQAEDEEGLANIGLEYMGDLAVLSPNTKVVQVPVADLQRSVVPAIDMMDRLVNERTSGYSTQGVFDGDQRKTKAEVMAHLEQAASLSDSSMDFFYGPWRRALQQMIRRSTNKKYLRTDPGGKEVYKLRQKLQDRGVPLEAFFKLDYEETMEMRVIGGGSAASKTVALSRMGELYARMDDVGKANYNRDIAVDIVGVSNASRYFTSNNEFRTTDDTQIAILQNYALLQGQDCPVLSSDKHLAHAREHIKPLMDMYQAAESGEMDLAQAATQYMLLYAHTSEHVQMIEGDIASVEEANGMRQLLQQIGEVISNGAKEAEAQQQQAAQEQAEQAQMGGGDEPQGDIRSEEKFAKAKAEIELMRQKAQVENELTVERAQVENSIKDANAAAEISRKGKVQRATQKPRPVNDNQGISEEPA